MTLCTPNSHMKLPKLFSLGGGAIALASLVFSSGCSTSVVTSRPYDNTAAPVMDGVIYSLPKQMLLVKVTRERVDRAKLVKAVTDLTKKVAEEATKLDFAKARAEELKFKLSLASDAEKPKLLAEKGIADLDVKFIEIGFKKLTVDLERSEQQLAQLPDGGTVWQDIIGCEAQAPVPDSQWTFVAQLDHSWTRADDLKLTTTDSGLLQGYIGTADYKTAEIVVKVIETAARLATPGLSLFSEPNKNFSTRIKVDEKPFKYERLIDPSKDSDWSDVMKDLGDLGAAYVFTLSDVPTPGPDRTQIEAPIKGLLYRRPVMRTLIVKLNNDYVFSKQLLLPNEGPVATLDLRASRGVVTKHEFAFKDGSLVNFGINRPSEGLAYVSVPADILRAVVSIPAELVQLKVDYSSKETALAKAETEYLKAQIDLLAAQQAAEAARKSE